MEVSPFSIAVSSSSSSSSSQAVIRSLSSSSHTSSLVFLRNNYYKTRHIKAKSSGNSAVRASLSGDSGIHSRSLSVNEFVAHFECTPS